TQMSPRPSRAMKLIPADVTCSAAMQRPPSFSRSSSSTMMTKRPSLLAAAASVTETKPTFWSFRDRERRGAPPASIVPGGARPAGRRTAVDAEPLERMVREDRSFPDLLHERLQEDL